MIPDCLPCGPSQCEVDDPRRPVVPDRARTALWGLDGHRDDRDITLDGDAATVRGCPPNDISDAGADQEGDDHEGGREAEADRAPP